MTVRLKPLKQQTIVVTGATSGIGLMIAQKAARRGAHVVLVARNEDVLKRTVADIRAEGGRADHVAADVGERDDVRKVVETTIARHGGFDTWVNDAGVGAYARLEDISDEDHHKLFQTNYWGVVYGSTEALKHLKERGGALINIGSIASDLPTPLLSSYAASKHAVKGFTDSLRLELLHDKAPVSVTLIKPSGINTPFRNHAINYQDVQAMVPPPVYHPALVAKAVLHAAEHPLRDVTIGGAGAAQIALVRMFPALADRLFTSVFFKTARDETTADPGKSALHDPGEGGGPVGDQDSYPIPMSPYTELQLHPHFKRALYAVAAGAAAAWVVKAINKGSRHA
jgi:short-subunit dehydrogenase